VTIDKHWKSMVIRCCTNLTDICVAAYILVLLQAYLPLFDSILFF
jgi:hypothetical protein